MAEMEGQQEGQGAADALSEGDFTALLQQEFKPKSDRAKEEVEKAVKTLAEQALANTSMVSSDVVESINLMIAEIDKRLGQQLEQILHNEKFQKLESSWRGLHYLVNNTETDEMLKIRVMDISKKDLHKTLKKYKAQPGTKVRSSRSSTSKSTDSSEANPTVAWSVITTSITARRTASFLARWRKFPRLHTLPSWLPPLQPPLRWIAGKS